MTDQSSFLSNLYPHFPSSIYSSHDDKGIQGIFLSVHHLEFEVKIESPSMSKMSSMILILSHSER